MYARFMDDFKTKESSTLFKSAGGTFDGKNVQNSYFLLFHKKLVVIVNFKDVIHIINRLNS